MQLCCQLLQVEVLNEFEYENGCLERANLKIDKICQPGISDTKAGYTWPHAQVFHVRPVASTCMGSFGTLIKVSAFTTYPTDTWTVSNSIQQHNTVINRPD